MWVVYKNVYEHKKGEKLLSKDIIKEFNAKEHAEQLLQQLVNDNSTESVDYSIDLIDTVQ